MNSGGDVPPCGSRPRVAETLGTIAPKVDGLTRLERVVQAAGDGLLRTSHAAIHHGGSGPTLAALVEGIPQLVLPDGSDRFIAAQAVRERGDGVQGAEDVSAELLERPVTDEKLGVAAREVRDESAGTTSPASVVSRLAAL